MLQRAVIFFIKDRVLSLTDQHVATDSVVIGEYTMEVFATFLVTRSKMDITRVRTSDGGNGNHSVSLPIILIKKVDQKFPSSFISLLLVSIL